MFVCSKNSGIDRKQDTSMIKPPPHAVPFSDEWLAAFEAAGEVISVLFTCGYLAFIFDLKLQYSTFLVTLLRRITCRPGTLVAPCILYNPN